MADERVRNVGANVGGAFAGESESLKQDGFLLRCAVFDVFVPVVFELLDAMNFLVFVGELQEVVRQAE